MKNYLGLLLIFIGMGMLIALAYLLSPLSRRPRVYSPYVLLTASWQNYKKNFMKPDGRIVSNPQGDITTSEGQSYAMLQAVWVDDRPAFDLAWNWTKSHLRRPHDNLFGWQWGRLGNGSYGFLDGGGSNAAPDADSDIALALILASRRWTDDSYRAQAVPIISDIWNIETTQVKGNRYLMAGNWADQPGKVIINPSYFAPYAWRIFREYDPGHDWNGMIAPAYSLLTESGRNNLGSGKSAGLPPDWVAINKDTGNLEPSGIPGQDTNYSFDAMRIPWRIALDYTWNGSAAAKNYLLTLGFLSQYFRDNSKLALSYYHDGTPVNQAENPAMYATSLAYFMATDPATATRIYQSKMVSLYSSDRNSFNNNIPYYESSWLWFGAALYNHETIPF